VRFRASASARFTLFSNGKMITSGLFKAGWYSALTCIWFCVVWDEIEKWIKTSKEYDELPSLGSGGNINKLFKLSVKFRKTIVVHMHELIIFF
jgi:exopolyphosphatase/guanosine-5'-triphosphate,3'-diphosphate pyrophosphatase